MCRFLNLDWHVQEQSKFLFYQCDYKYDDCHEYVAVANPINVAIYKKLCPKLISQLDFSNLYLAAAFYSHGSNFQPTFCHFFDI